MNKKKQAGTRVLALAMKGRGVDLPAGRFYRVLGRRGDVEAGFLRVVDRSGEDYLYPESLFRLSRVPADELEEWLSYRVSLRSTSTNRNRGASRLRSRLKQDPALCLPQIGLDHDRPIELLSPSARPTQRVPPIQSSPNRT